MTDDLTLDEARREIEAMPCECGSEDGACRGNVVSRSAALDILARVRLPDTALVEALADLYDAVQANIREGDRQFMPVTPAMNAAYYALAAAQATGRRARVEALAPRLRPRRRDDRGHRVTVGLAGAAHDDRDERDVSAEPRRTSAAAARPDSPPVEHWRQLSITAPLPVDNPPSEHDCCLHKGTDTPPHTQGATQPNSGGAPISIRPRAAAFALEPCACGGTVRARVANPGPGVSRHNRTPRHRAWRAEREP